MHSFLRPRLDLAAAGLAAVTAVAVLTAPPPAVVPSTPPVVTAEVRLAAAPVPPGGLVISFWRNQAVYCSLICPLLAQTGVTAVTTTLQAPGRFLAALSAGDVLKAVGAAAASVTGPTRVAAQRAIDVDQAIPAQRALNAFQVGVVGLLDVPPAARGGVPAVVAALRQARRDTYAALNLPFVPDPAPTVTPHGVFQVAVIAATDVVAAVIFPAFNTVLAGVFAVPDAVAQELARTGNPVRALRAGVDTATAVVDTAGSVLKRAVVDAVDDVREAADRRPPRAPIPSQHDEVVSRHVEQPSSSTPPGHRVRDLLRSSSDPRRAEHDEVHRIRPQPDAEDTDAEARSRRAHHDSGDAPEHDAGESSSEQQPARGVSPA